MKLRHLERVQTIPRPIEEAFGFFANPRNLEELTPRFLHFRFMREPPETLEAGSLLDYRIFLYGIPIHWQTRIELWEPPRLFVDLQVKGPYAYWRHSHRFEAIEDGRATLIRDQVEFAIPLGPLGELSYCLFVARSLKEIFDFRAQRLGDLFGCTN